MSSPYAFKLSKLLLLSVGYSSTGLSVAFSTKNLSESFLTPQVVPGKYLNPNPSAEGSFSLNCAAKNTGTSTPRRNGESFPERHEGEPWYWIDDDVRDAFGVIYRKRDENVKNKEDTPNRISNIYFKVRGNPRPLQRHRTSRGHVYNPSLKYQRSFLDAFENLMTNVHAQTIDTPLFGATDHLGITIIFRMKRPKSHFVNGRPGPDRLKKNAPSQLSSIRTDVDNLTKFVLDSMNGILYEDDRQIASIHATKLLDNDVLCEGSIEVHVRSIKDDDVEKILQSFSFPVEQEAD